jgi:cytochrome c-type biogenesis protein CcmH
MRKILFLLLLVSGFSQLYAGEAELLEDPKIKDRFKAVASELRCLKCQNQTIYDSKAGLADDLRKQIRTQIYAGKTDEEIVDYMVARYGDFVRYKPAMDSKNMLLWAGPFIFMFIGGVMLVRYINIRRKETVGADEGTITEEDHLRAKRILEEGGDK